MDAHVFVAETTVLTLDPDISRYFSICGNHIYYSRLSLAELGLLRGISNGPINETLIQGGYA